MVAGKTFPLCLYVIRICLLSPDNTLGVKYLLYFFNKIGIKNRIYPPELQLNKANTSDTETPFLDLHLSISNGFVSSKIYDKRDDLDFDIVNFLFFGW